MDFSPYMFTIALLRKIGFKRNKEIANADKKGIKKEQLKALNKLTASRKEIKTSAYETIHKARQSPNDLNINNAAKRAIYGATQYSVMKHIDELSPKEKSQIIIKWLPTSSNEPSVAHARQYMKTMTLERALQLGLGLQYGCKCGFQILKGREIFNKHMEKIS